MEKVKLDYVIVCEGKSDQAFLQSFIDTIFVTTNGSDVPRETIEYIRQLSKTRQIVVLTDPDFPGKQIRDKLDANIPGLHHAFMPKEKCIKHGKVGVAESDRETVLLALSKIVSAPSSSSSGWLSMSDLFDLGLVGEGSEKRRKMVQEKLGIGFCNAKTTLKRLNSLNVNRSQLEEILNGRI